jgi:hypothetical protein
MSFQSKFNAQSKSKSANPFAALMADESSDDDQQEQQQQKIEIQVPRTPPTAPAPTQAPNAPIRKPYGWKPESQKVAQAQAQKIIKEDEFPSLGRSVSGSIAKTGAWSNGVKSIHDAKDIVPPKPVLSMQAQKRLRYGAARRLLDGVAYVDAQFEGDVTIFFNNGQAQILEDDDEDQEYEDQEYASGVDPEWEM